MLDTELPCFKKDTIANLRSRLVPGIIITRFFFR